MGVAKCFLIVFNSIFFLLGGTCLGIGVWIYVDQPSLLKLTAMVDQLDGDAVIGLLKAATIALMAGGGFVFIIGFLGCCGAIKESKCLLYMYALVVALILSAEIAGGVLGFIYRDKIESELQTYMQRTIDDKYNGAFDFSTGAIITTEVFSLAWEFVHWQFECCGVNGSTSFDNAVNWNRTTAIPGTSFTVNLTAPFTCCKINSGAGLPTNIDAFVNITQCILNVTDTTYSNAHLGCFQSMKDKIFQYSTIIMAVGIGIALIEIIGIVAACCMIKDIKKKDEKDK